MRTRIFLSPSNNNLEGKHFNDAEHVHCILDSSLQAFSVTLPDLFFSVHKAFIFYNLPAIGNGNDVTINVKQGQKINQSDNSHIITAYDTVAFVSDLNSRWLIANIVKLTDSNGNLVLPKTSGRGIKVEKAAPTFPWRDLKGPAHILSPGANDPTLATFRNGIKGYSFSNAVMNEMWFEFHIDHDHVPSSDIYIHTHWSQNVVDTGGGGGTPGAVKWQFEVTYAKGHNQAAYPATFTTSLTQTASGTQYQHMLAEVQLSAASPSATQLDSDVIEIDGIIKVRCFRDPTDVADTLNQVPFLDFVDIHYQSTGIGTKQKAPNFYI